MVVINASTGISAIQDGTVTSAKIVDSTIQQSDMSIGATSVGVGQTWKSVSRAVNTTYTNTTGKPIIVVYGFETTATAAYISAVVSGFTVDSKATASVAYPIRVSALVPAGATYSFGLSAGSPTGTVFYELS